MDRGRVCDEGARERGSEGREERRDVCLSLGEAWLTVGVQRVCVFGAPRVHWDGSTLPRDGVRTL